MANRPFIARHRLGFTMLEIIVVLIVMTVVAGIAVPSFVTAMPGYRLRSDMSDLFSLTRFARNQAAVTGLRHRVVLDASGGAFRLEGEFDPFSAPGTWTAAEGGWGRNRNFHGAVSILEVLGTSNQNNLQAVTFRADGQVEETILIILGLPDDPDARMGLSVRGITGLARVLEGEDLEEAIEEMLDQ
jgi:prepilin-type N-terminal cleavage/methylation domain-containing protein